LHRTDDIRGDAGALRERMQREGYLYLPGLLHRDEVLAARRSVTERLAAAGQLDPEFPHEQSVAHPDSKVKFMPALAENNPALSAVLYAGPMMEFFTEFLGGPVLHYDFTWMRAVSPGKGTQPHCDVVYMGRGTRQLFTAWTPLGDIGFDQGGLMILESSPQQADRLRKYLSSDVDSYCANGPFAEAIESGKRGWTKFNGALSNNPVTLRAKLGGRWLTAEYTAGDVLIFNVTTIHASLDNPSRHIRLSSDTRYQLASQPADERWIGAQPIGHGRAGKRGRIC
jgi:ectoine hydroxylase-related dioxygenase (phytanoyl-CoA dioxygenase family)